MSEGTPFFQQGTIVKLIDYSMEVARLESPDEVPNSLHEIVSEKARIRVHGASRFSAKFGDWRRIEVGKNVFLSQGCASGVGRGGGPRL